LIFAIQQFITGLFAGNSQLVSNFHCPFPKCSCLLLFQFLCPRALLRAEDVLERKGKNLSNFISELGKHTLPFWLQADQQWWERLTPVFWD